MVKLAGAIIGCAVWATGCPRARPGAATGWTARAAVVEVGSRAGIGDFHRIFHYSRATGVLSVDDSDPFAAGQEEHPARVLRRSITLAASDRRALETILSRVNPDSDALARRCAPGGCSWMVCDDGERIEDAPIVRETLTELSRYFPELRQY